jgi:hypothetical protein
MAPPSPSPRIINPYTKKTDRFSTTFFLLFVLLIFLAFVNVSLVNLVWDQVLLNQVPQLDPVNHEPTTSTAHALPIEVWEPKKHFAAEHWTRYFYIICFIFYMKYPDRAYSSGRSIYLGKQIVKICS